MKAEGITIDGGQLCIGLVEFVESLPDDAKHEVAKACAFDAELIEMIVGMVGSDWAFHEEDGGWSLDTRMLTKIRERLVPMMDEVVQQLVGHLLRDRDQEHLEVVRWRKAYYDLYHHHNDTLDRECGPEKSPPVPRFVQPPWPTTENTAYAIAKATEEWGLS